MAGLSITKIQTLQHISPEAPRPLDLGLRTPQPAPDLVAEALELLQRGDTSAGWRIVATPSREGVVVDIAFGASSELYLADGQNNHDFGVLVSLLRGETIANITAVIQPYSSQNPANYAKCRAFPLIVRASVPTSDLEKVPRVDPLTGYLPKETEVVLRKLGPESIFAIGLFQTSTTGDFSLTPLWKQKVSDLVAAIEGVCPSITRPSIS